MISRDIQRVIISGATSSIGIALCEECVTNGIGVVAIIRPESSKCSLIPKSNLIEIVESELSDYDSINSEGIHADAFFILRGLLQMVRQHVIIHMIRQIISRQYLRLLS